MKPNLGEIKERISKFFEGANPEEMKAWFEENYEIKEPSQEEIELYKEIADRTTLPTKLEVCVSMRLKCLIEDGVTNTEQMAEIITFEVLRVIAQHEEAN